MRSSKYSVFDHINHTGHWRQLTVRTTREEGGTMAIVEFVVQETTAVRYFSILLLKIIKYSGNKFRHLYTEKWPLFFHSRNFN